MMLTRQWKIICLCNLALRHVLDVRSPGPVGNAICCNPFQSDVGESQESTQSTKHQHC